MLKDISHMPARVKCAELAWRTLKEMLEAREGNGAAAAAPASGAPTTTAADKAKKEA